MPNKERRHTNAHEVKYKSQRGVEEGSSLQNLAENSACKIISRYAKNSNAARLITLVSMPYIFSCILVTYLLSIIISISTIIRLEPASARCLSKHFSVKFYIESNSLACLYMRSQS